MLGDSKVVAYFDYLKEYFNYRRACLFSLTLMQDAVDVVPANTQHFGFL